MHWHHLLFDKPAKTRISFFNLTIIYLSFHRTDEERNQQAPIQLTLATQVFVMSTDGKVRVFLPHRRKLCSFVFVDTYMKAQRFEKYMVSTPHRGDLWTKI